MRGPKNTVAELIPDFLLAKDHLSPATLKEYRRYLADFDAWANHPTLEEVLPPLVGNYVRDRKTTSHYVARYAGAVLKTFASYLADQGYLRGPYGGSVLTSVKLPKVPRDGRLAIERDDIYKIMDVLARSPQRTRARDTALFMLLLATGLRLNEARQLLLDDVHIEPRNSFIDVRWQTTKGKSARRIRLDPKAAGPIRTYIADWRPTYSDHVPEPLFLTEEGKAFKPGGFQSYTARLKDQFEQAGVRDWKAHRMRTTWATNYHSASNVTGTTLYDLQREGGWKDDSTPRRYTKDRPWDELAAMPTALSVILARRVS